MAQLFDEVVEYNAEKLREEDAKLLKELYDLKETEGASIVVRLLEVQANIRLLDIHNSEDMNDLAYRKGSLDGLKSFITKAKASIHNEKLHRANKEKKEDKRRAKGVRKIQRVSPAGAADY